jgi:hypothetical protein
MTGKSNEKALTPEEEEEREDERKLRESSVKIEEILSLIEQRHDRAHSEQKLESARRNTCLNMEGDNTDKLSGNVFHLLNGKRIPLKLRNSRLLDVVDALELHIKTHSHGEDLQKALTGQINRKIKLLEKILDRLKKKHK